MVNSVAQAFTYVRTVIIEQILRMYVQLWAPEKKTLLLRLAKECKLLRQDRVRWGLNPSPSSRFPCN